MKREFKRVCTKEKGRIEMIFFFFFFLRFREWMSLGLFILKQHVDWMWHETHTRRHTLMIQMSPNHHQSCVVTHERLASLQGCHHNLCIFLLIWYYASARLPSLHQEPTKPEEWKTHQRFDESDGKQLQSIGSSRLSLRGCFESARVRRATWWLSGWNIWVLFPPALS